VTDDDCQTLVAVRGDPMKRSRHAQRDLLAGFAIHETDAQIPTNDPLSKYVGCQAGLSRLAIASAH
jgi:hypothetical protein